MKIFTLEEYFKQPLSINPIIVLNLMLIILCFHSFIKITQSKEGWYSSDDSYGNTEEEYYVSVEKATENYEIYLDMSQHLLPYIAIYELLFVICFARKLVITKKKKYVYDEAMPNLKYLTLSNLLYLLIYFLSFITNDIDSKAHYFTFALFPLLVGQFFFGAFTYKYINGEYHIKCPHCNRLYHTSCFEYDEKVNLYRLNNENYSKYRDTTICDSCNKEYLVDPSSEIQNEDRCLM